MNPNKNVKYAYNELRAAGLNMASRLSYHSCEIENTKFKILSFNRKLPNWCFFSFTWLKNRTFVRLLRSFWKKLSGSKSENGN